MKGVVEQRNAALQLAPVVAFTEQDFPGKDSSGIVDTIYPNSDNVIMIYRKSRTRALYVFALEEFMNLSEKLPCIRSNGQIVSMVISPTAR